MACVWMAPDIEAGGSKPAAITVIHNYPRQSDVTCLLFGPRFAGLMAIGCRKLRCRVHYFNGTLQRHFVYGRIKLMGKVRYTRPILLCPTLHPKPDIC